MVSTPNNITQEDCDAFNDKCKKQIDDALEIAETLMNKMNDDGIAHIVFMGPFYVLGLNKAIDYGYNKLDEICAQNKNIDCYVVDTRPVDPEKPADGDHVHPSPEGYRQLAHAIWAVIVDNNIPLASPYN
jgi:lysophospholipase L1-like esterase